MTKIQLSIPRPCHENWSKMSKAEQGRFCNSCQKVVINFSLMTDQELLNYFKRPVPGVCGHFQERQLNRVIAPPSKPRSWFKYLLQIALPAFLFTAKSAAQRGRVVAVVQQSNVAESRPPLATTIHAANASDTLPPQLQTIDGRVEDENGFPVPYATVMIKGTRVGTAADSAGRFSIKVEEGKPLVLVISALGFVTQEVAVTTGQQAQFVLVRSEAAILGEVVVVRKKKKEIPLLIKQQTKNSNNLHLFPNPVTAGGEIKMQVTKPSAGEYELRITAAGGSALLVKKLVLKQGESSFAVTLPNVPAGMYLVQLKQVHKKEVYTSKLLVQ